MGVCSFIRIAADDRDALKDFSKSGRRPIQKAAKAEIVEIEFDEPDGEMVYEAEIRVAGTEIEVSADGEIPEVEDDEDDDR